MGKFFRLATALALTVVAAALLSACGSSNSNNKSSGGNGKTGGSITIGTVGPDSYDPVLFQTVQASQALMPVYLPLLTYKHESGPSGADLVPGLADAMPAVSNGGKTYKFKLRKGVKYSDGSPVKASDFENTIKRLVILGGPYSSFLTGIKGAEGIKTIKDDIPGIKTDDATGAITINLTTADGKFPFALGEPYAAPTPAAKSPAKSLTKSPPPGAGQYKIDVVDPSKKFVLTKNANFDIPGLPKGNLDTMTGVVETVPRMTQDVINNKIDFMTEDPTGDLLVQVKQKYKDRFRLDPNPPNTYYFFLNETVPPFDKLEARQAVNYALDSRALQRVFSGRLKPTCSFLAPGVIGYKEPNPCPWGDPNGPPQIDKAKQLVKKSGTAGQSVTVWTNTKDPRPAIGDYYRDMLNQIGYKAKTKTLDQQVYFDQVGNPKNKAQTGFTDWFQDFPHPADFFEPLLSAKALKSNPTFNLTFKADPSVDAQINKLTPEADPQKVADQWAALDQEVTGLKKAHVAVYGSEQSSTFMSNKMDFANCNGVHPVYKNDWIAFCLK